MAQADGFTNLNSGEQELTIIRSTEAPGVDYFLRFAANGADPVTFGGRTGYRLVIAEVGGGPFSFAWQEGDVTFTATGFMDHAIVEAALASLGPVDDAEWQAMLQRTEDLPNGMSVEGIDG